MVRVHVPIVEYPDPVEQRPNPLPRSLAGVTLGILDNQKPNSTLLIEAILGALPPSERPARLVRAFKSPPIPAPEEALTTLSGGVDMTLIASAD
jgi:hypothetical protein